MKSDLYMFGEEINILENSLVTQDVLCCRKLLYSRGTSPTLRNGMTESFNLALTSSTLAGGGAKLGCK